MEFLLALLFITHSLAHASEKPFDNVMVKYEHLHQSFFDNDNDKVKKASKELLEAIGNVKDENISKKLAYSQQKLSQMSTADDLEENKKAFNTVSQGLLVVLEKDVGKGNYARYYCPMVKKYWIQNTTKSDKVMNPYASDSMPHCGSKK